MEENKYYTPTIEEFHVGFEFEFQTGINGWKPFALTTDRTQQVLRNVEDFKSQFRVKYLDKEDIESLGWKLSGDGFTFQTVGENGMDYILIKIQPVFGENKFEIRPLNPSNEYGGFYGIIQNKIELKHLMKQTCIIK